MVAEGSNIRISNTLKHGFEYNLQNIPREYTKP